MVSTAPSTGPDTGTRRARSVPATVVRELTASAGTSPGRLSLIAIGLVLLSVLTAVVAAVSLQDKQDTIDDLTGSREPLAAAAQQVYRSLSDADATASAAFLSGGVEPAQLRARYQGDIAQAGAALAKASSDVSGFGSAQAQVNQLAQQLPVYTGLVETARANNRQGFPAGAAYLREASELMRSKLLPAAQELYSIDVDRLAAGQDDATSVPWLLIALAVALLAALLATQVYLTRRTNRLLNVGLLAATAAVGVGVLWGVAVLLVVSVQVDAGRTEGSQPVDVLVRARIVALQCRSDETLTLVARGDGGIYEQQFQQLIGALVTDRGGPGTLLRQARDLAGPDGPTAPGVAGAIDNARLWRGAHMWLRQLDDAGDYQKAVDAATGTAPTSAAMLFGSLDADLGTAITSGRRTFVQRTDEAGTALTGLVPGVVGLGLVAAVGATAGIRQRLREYR